MSSPRGDHAVFGWLHGGQHRDMILTQDSDYLFIPGDCQLNLGVHGGQGDIAGAPE